MSIIDKSSSETPVVDTPLMNTPVISTLPVEKPVKYGPPLPLTLTIERARNTSPIGSPCTTVCRLDEETRTYCRGCHRTRDEIKAWKSLPDDARTAVLAVLLTRQAQHPVK